MRGELLDDLLAGRVTDREALENRTTLLGLDLTRPHVLVVVDHGDHRRTATWTTGYGMSHHDLAATRGEHTVLLLPGADPSAVANQVGWELESALGHPGDHRRRRTGEPAYRYRARLP